MAINRFSTIQGLPEWQPQIPLDILVKGLTYKQELFDKNKALLETNVSLGKSVADLILNDEAKKYTQDKVNSYKSYLNTNLAYADLTDDGVMKTADNKLGELTNDMDIVNWVSKSKNTTKEMNRIDELKKKGDARYDQLHENSFMLDVNALKTSGMKDGLNLATPSYTDFYDADKEKQELIKNFKPNHIKYSKILPGGRMMDVEDQSVYQEQLQAYLEANLSDKAKRELAFRGEYEYKAGYQYEKDDTRKQNFANNISNRYIGIVDGQIKAIDTQIAIMKQQQFKLDPKDKNYDSQLTEIKNNIDLYERQKLNHINDKTTFLKDPTKYTKDISQRLYISSYVANAAKGNTRIDKSETLKSDEAYWSGLKYDQEERKFAYQKQKDILDRELEYFKAGIKLDANGNLVQQNAFGTTGSAGGGFQNLSFGGNETVDVTKGEGLEFIREVEKGALVAKEQIYNDYFRKWEQEAAGATGFFTAEQKAEWNKQDAAWKKDYFQQKVLPLYYQYMEGNNFSMTMPDGTKVTRNANYVPQWFKDMRNDPRYRNTYTALSVATAVKNNISETYKDYDGLYKDRNGQKLSATDLAEMSQLQGLIEDSKYSGFHDANTLNNLKNNINNYLESNGSSTGSGFVDLARTLGPGTNFNQQEIAELSRKFGGTEKLKKVVDNLLYNTREGGDLLAFGGHSISNAFQSNIPGAPKPFERLSDETRTVINNAINGMVISQPKYNVINKENDFYKKRQNPDAIALANQALDDGGRINNFSLNSNSFEFEGLSGGGEMTFSYIKGDLSEGKSYAAMTETLSRIANSSGGKITYDGEANTLRIKVDPKKLGILQDYTELYQSRVLFDSGYLKALPTRNYYARDPKQNVAKAFSYQFSKNSAGETELAFYRDGKKITIPRITEAEAKAAGVMVTSNVLDLDPPGADLAFSRYLSQYDQTLPGNNYNSLDKLINYAENNQ